MRSGFAASEQRDELSTRCGGRTELLELAAADLLTRFVREHGSPDVDLLRAAVLLGDVRDVRDGRAAATEVRRRLTVD